ncbi:MAG: 2TM domain-containing protein [Flavobacteriaceae bacterium]
MSAVDNNKEDRKYIRARKRVDELKKYYKHLTAYILVNILITSFQIVNDVRDGDSINEAIFESNSYSLWLWWGIGLAFHTYKVFGANLLFMNKDWEDRKIKKYMDEK